MTYISTILFCIVVAFAIASFFDYHSWQKAYERYRRSYRNSLEALEADQDFRDDVLRFKLTLSSVMVAGFFLFLIHRSNSEETAWVFTTLAIVFSIIFAAFIGRVAWAILRTEIVLFLEKRGVRARWE